VLFVVNGKDDRNDTIAVWTPDGKRKNLLRIPGGAVQIPVYSSSGHVIYWRLDTDHEAFGHFHSQWIAWNELASHFPCQTSAQFPAHQIQVRLPSL